MRIALVALLAAGSLAGVAAPSADATQDAGGCGSALRPEADADSFTGDADRLARETAANFAAAAARLCGSGALRAADLRAFSRLLVRNTAGAVDPIVYDDAEQGPDTLILEYGFSGAAPAETAIGSAIRCWREPTRAGCDQATD